MAMKALTKYQYSYNRFISYLQTGDVLQEQKHYKFLKDGELRHQYTKDDILDFLEMNDVYISVDESTFGHKYEINLLGWGKFKQQTTCHNKGHSLRQAIIDSFDMLNFPIIIKEK